MTDIAQNPLGRSVAYPDRYDPGLLFAIARAPNRAALGIGAALPFHGVDVWNAYEFGWLDARGKPVVAIAEFRVPAASPAIIESKSFKLYLNGWASERCSDAAAVQARLAADLSHCAGAAVTVALTPASRFASLVLAEPDGDSIDDRDLAIDCYGPPAPALLRADAGDDCTETLRSDLLKSNCPVTGQPDWASLQIRYAGPRIDRDGLLRYLVSFREHSGFHEDCVERIWVDLRARCAPRELSVFARYTRRGGLDINPYRSSAPADPPNRREARQ